MLAPWVPTIVSQVTTELDVHLIMEVVVAVAVEVTAPSCEVEPDIRTESEPCGQLLHVLNCCRNSLLATTTLFSTCCHNPNTLAFFCV